MNKEIREYLNDSLKELIEEEDAEVIRKGAAAYDAGLDAENRKLQKLKREVGLINKMTKSGRAKVKELEYQQAKVNKMKAKSPEEKEAEMSKKLGYSASMNVKEDNQPTAGMSLDPSYPSVQSPGAARNTSNAISYRFGYRQGPRKPYEITEEDIMNAKRIAEELGYDITTEEANEIIKTIYEENSGIDLEQSIINYFEKNEMSTGGITTASVGGQFAAKLGEKPNYDTLGKYKPDSSYLFKRTRVSSKKKKKKKKKKKNESINVNNYIDKLFE